MSAPIHSKLQPYSLSQIIEWQRAWRSKRYEKRVANKSPAYKTPLFVRMIESEEDKIKIHEILKSWKIKLDGSNLNSTRKGHATSYTWEMCRFLTRKKNVEWIGCFDANENLQAIAAYNMNDDPKHGIELKYLVSGPENLSTEAPLVRGAGTALIERLVHIALRNPNASTLITLDPAEDASPFYLKLGMKMGDDQQMRLTIGDTPSFLNKFAGRAQQK